MNTEREANEKRNWKAMLFPYDEFVPDESPECQYCLTDKQAEFLRGLLEPTAWKTRWWSDETEIDQDTISQFRDDLIRRLMMSCCGGEFEIIFQWTEDGELQQSEDGGATWEDAPQEDPRNSSTVYPPTPGSPSDTKKCDASEGMSLLIKEQVGEQLTDDMSRYTLAQLVHDWVTTYIQTSNPFEALIQIAANQIFALVIATLSPALTDDVYHLLTCAFLCLIADDLSFDNERWEAVRTKILDTISGIAGIFLEHLVFLLGPVGITNLARAQVGATGDCSDCEECPDCVDGCLVDWTFYGVVDVVKIDDCHYTMTTSAALGHFAFTSGNLANGCYFDNSYGFLYAWSSWGVGSAGINNVNPKTSPIWNFDTGNIPDATMLDVRFSTAPFV